MSETTGKLLYGALFTLAWPGALALWSWSLDASGFVSWTVPVPPWSGWLLLLTGLALMAVAMLALVRNGGGLPMNAYPTTRFVTGSAYALMAHPIYVGFTLAVLGAAVVANSPAGFWFAAPLSALASAALVIGYEGPKLRDRFGPRPLAPIFALPLPDEKRVPMPRRAVLCGMTLGLWAALYALIGLGTPPCSSSLDSIGPISWPTTVSPHGSWTLTDPSTRRGWPFPPSTWLGLSSRRPASRSAGPNCALSGARWRSPSRRVAS